MEAKVNIHDLKEVANVYNLKILADGLLALPRDYRHFDMERYFGTGMKPDKQPAEASACDTVACAAGHGPMFGLAGLPGEDWQDYIRRVFFIDEQGVASPALEYFRWFSWCFASEWAEFDNTPHGAGKRIAYALDHGIPESADVETAFRAELLALLKKYDAELEAKDHYSGYAECGVDRD